MASKYSVLQNAQKSDVRLAPYPYVVVDNALPADLYAELSRTFPALYLMGIFRRGNNKRFNYPLDRVQRSFLISRTWRAFLAYQASDAFFHEIVELFFDGMHALYPDRFRTLEQVRALRTGHRGPDKAKTVDVALDSMISGNTPVTAASSVRTTHVDAGDKLYSGLFYMRPDADIDSVGGNLTISRFKPQYGGPEKIRCFDYQYVDDGYVDLVDTVQYGANRLVLMINSLDSLHGVTVRQPTRHVRRFVNLVGEVDPPLYQLPERSAAGRTPAYA